MIIEILTISIAGLLNGCTNENVNIGNTLQNSRYNPVEVTKSEYDLKSDTSVLDKVIHIISDNFGYQRLLFLDSKFVIHNDWEGVYIRDDVINFHDELYVIELIMAFEEEWGLEIPDNKAENFKTVGDIVKYIEENK